MFRGEFQHCIDDKGRVIIPAKFRQALGEKFVISKGLDNCLFVFPEGEWRVFEERLRGLQLTKPDARAFVRFFASGATECTFDRQGRILIPNSLREYARLEKDVVVIGVITRVEIWSRERWEEYSMQLSPEAIAEKIVDLGI